MLYGWPVREEDLLGFSRFESPVHIQVPSLIFSCDFMVSLGSEVLAMADGEVTYVKQDSKSGGNDLVPGMDVRESKYWNLGNRIEIAHKDGDSSGYEHLAFGSSLVRVGDRVRKGQQIAATGFTGLMAHLGPHLHVERLRYFGDGDEDYETFRIEWEKQKLLFSKYFWDYGIWRAMEEGVF